MLSEHDRVVELLTWFVNGTLDVREQERVVQHLEHCEICRGELSLQQQLRNAIAQPSKVEFAPQTSFNKLWERISDEQLGQRPTALAGAWHRLWLSWLKQQWMPLTLGLQALIIAGLSIAFALHNGGNEAAYRTVTAPNNENRAIVHAVFDDATRLSDVKDILNKTGLEVASGPTAAGVYSLTPDAARSRIDLNASVDSLRADPRVRFAELSHP